jgi:hypothetical protein
MAAILHTNKRKKSKKDIELIIKELHQCAGLGEYPFTDGIGYGGIIVK